MKLFAQEGLISAIICLSAYQILSGNSGLMETMKPLADIVAKAIPSVLVMSTRAENPQLAEITWAMQWIFFPIYFFTLLKCNPPRSKRVEAELMKNPYGMKFGFGRSFMTILFWVFICCMILSDFRVIDFFSFVRGIGFEVDGDIAKAPALIRFPLKSNFGMLLYAWFFPFGLAFIYWGSLIMILNPKAFIRSANS